MNYFVLIAGIVSLAACIGHFTMGLTQFVRPVVKSDIDLLPRMVMLSVFHYMSVFMVFTTIVLFYYALGISNPFNCPKEVMWVIAICYFGYGVVSLAISTKVGIFKMFQWVFWFLIALFTILGLA